jgi:hypothetical protein
LQESTEISRTAKCDEMNETHEIYAATPKPLHTQYRTNPKLQLILQLRCKALITLT